MYDAFISYRRSDRITADGVARFLDAFGLTVFVDRSSRAGTAWEPELRAALASAKVLVVLWSRSAAHSDWVEQEWRNVSPSCRIVPIKLDGEKLPADLEGLTAVEGLDVGSRLLQRTFELMQQGKLSPAQAQEQLVQELAADGIVLEPKKREALAVFLSFVAGLAGALAMTHAGNATQAARAMDSLPPSAQTAPPPPLRTASWISQLGALGLSAAAAFSVGYWWHQPAAAATAPPECPPPSASPAAANTAPICPPAPSCAPGQKAPAPACPCSQAQCSRAIQVGIDSRELGPSLQACEKQRDDAKAALKECTVRNVAGRLGAVPAVRGPAMVAAGGAAPAPVVN